MRRQNKKRTFKKISAFTLSTALAVSSPMVAFAAGPGGNAPGGDAPGGGSSSSSSITWSGATEITSATETTDQTYTSTSADQNAVLINTTDTVTLNNPTVTKSGGDSAGDNYSFYGINSGIMAKGGGTTNIVGGTVQTTGAGANGIFSYGANSGSTNAEGDGTTVNISDVTITTTAQGSGGIMTTYGGTTNATNLTITTEGGSSAPIRTDRGGGWVTVDGGTYTSNGLGSPAIYSTADIDVSNATLVSNLSEGVCIEGTGSISLTDCDLTANNTSTNGNATFYDTIMIYQSMSGDASTGTSEYTMKGGSLTSKNGDTFHVTNTAANINLEGVTITNSSDGALLSVCDDGWTDSSNPCNEAIVTAANQTLEGDMLVGSDSSLTLTMSGTTFWTGKTSGEISNAAGTSVSTSIGTVDVTMSDDATWVLTGDSTVSSLSGSGYINYNGYTLTVGSTAYTSGSIGNIEETSNTTAPDNNTYSSDDSSSSDSSSSDSSSSDSSSSDSSSSDSSSSSSDSSSSSTNNSSTTNTSGTSSAANTTSTTATSSATSATTTTATNSATTTTTSTNEKVAFKINKNNKAVKKVTVKKGKTVKLKIKSSTTGATFKIVKLTAKNKKVATAKLKGKKLTLKGKKAGKYTLKIKGTADGYTAVTKLLKVTVK